MTKKTALASFLLLLMLTGSAQTPSSKTDSLLRIVDGAGKKAEARIFNEIAESYLPGDPAKCINYAEKALDRAQKQQDKDQTGIAHKNMGAGFATLYQYDNALLNYSQALDIFNHTINRLQIASVLGNMGLVYRERNEYAEAMDKFSRALEIYRSLKDASGEAKVRYMLGSLALRRGNYSVALDNYKEALKIRQKINNTDDIAVAYSYIALVYKEQSKYDSAIAYYQKALDIRSAGTNRSLYANTLNEMGGVYWSQRNYEKALEYYFRSIKIRYETADKKEIANSYQNIGNLFSNLGNTDKAREYYQQALKINMESDDKRKIASTVTVLGNLEFKVQNFQEALNYFTIALNYRKTIGEKKEISISLNSLGNVYSELNNEQKAIQYFSDALKMRRDIRDSNGEIITLNGLGNLYQKAKKTNQALSYFEAGYKIANETANTLYIGICARKIAEELLFQNHPEKVESLLNISLASGKKLDNPELNKLAYYGLYQYFKKRGNFEKALLQYELFATVKDSMQYAQNSLQMLSIQQNLELEKKNNEIKIIEGQVDKLREEKDKQTSRLEKERIVLIFLLLFICFIFVVAILLYNRYQIRKKNTLRLQQQNEQLEEANSRLEKSEADLNRLNATKDKYFGIIAHDLKNPLSALLNFSHIIIERYDSLKDSDIKDFNRHIHESASNINNLLENLLNWAKANTNKLTYTPVRVKLLPVIKSMWSLHELAAKQKNLRIQIEVSEEIQVFADIQMLSLILRNLISNAVKFTTAGGQITIKAIETIRRVEVSITDNGVGIDAQNVDKLFRIDAGVTTAGTNNEHGSGLGLLLVKEFVEKNKGQVYVVSLPGKGSTFTFSLPNYV